MLICSKCKIEKPEEQFYKNKSPHCHDRAGRHHWCKDCHREYHRENRVAHNIRTRRSAIKRRYGMSMEEYDALIARGCSICGSRARMVMDHCHATNAVRAPLCHKCNTLLGLSDDDPVRLRAAADYLERHAAA